MIHPVRQKVVVEMVMVMVAVVVEIDEPRGVPLDHLE